MFFFWSGSRFIEKSAPPSTAVPCRRSNSGLGSPSCLLLLIRLSGDSINAWSWALPSWQHPPPPPTPPVGWRLPPASLCQAGPLRQKAYRPMPLGMGCPTQWGVVPLYLLLRPPHSSWHLCPPTQALPPPPSDTDPRLSPLPLSGPSPRGPCLRRSGLPWPLLCSSPKTAALGSLQGLLPLASETQSQTLIPPGAWLSPNTPPRRQFFICALTPHATGTHPCGPPMGVPLRPGLCSLPLPSPP